MDANTRKETVMSKPLSEFGGWLAFFNFTLWLNVVVVVLMSIFLLFSFFKVSNSTYIMGIFITFVRYLVSGFLFFQMIKLEPAHATFSINFYK